MLPSPGAFDHVITLADLDGEPYWLDGTRNYQGSNIDKVAVTSFGKALVLREGEDALTAVRTRHSNDIDLTETIVAENYSEPVLMTHTTVFEGSSAEWYRRRLERNDLDQISQDYLDYFARFYPEIELAGSFQVEDDLDANRITLKEFYSIPHYWDVEGKNRIASFYTTNFYGNADKPERLKRNGPYWPGGRVNLKQKTLLTFPEDIDLKLDGWDVSIANDYFRYQTDASYEGKTLKINSYMTVGGQPVPKEDIHRYARDMGHVIEELDFTLTFDDPEYLSQERNRLLDRLEQTLTGIIE